MVLSYAAVGGNIILAIFTEKVKPRFIAFLPAFAWLIFVVILLVMPSEDIPQASIFDAIYFDKWVHAGLFGMLMLLWSFPFFRAGSNSLKPFTAILVLVIGFGVMMEFVQRAVGRDYDVNDMIADSVGAVAVWIWLVRKIQARKQKQV